MKENARYKTGKGLIILLALGGALLAQLTFGLGLHQTPIDTWIPSSNSDSCSSNLTHSICAQWFTNSGIVFLCCVPPSAVGTSDADAGVQCLGGLSPRDIVE